MGAIIQPLFISTYSGFAVKNFEFCRLYTIAGFKFSGAQFI